VAALSADGRRLDRREFDELLTDCAGVMLSIAAELRRVDRGLDIAAQSAANGRHGGAEAERLANRREELTAERSRLSSLIAELRERRDGLTRGDGQGPELAAQPPSN
jgi:hypothetical protein